MTDTEQKALALVNKFGGGCWLPHEVDRITNFSIICRSIEAHEATKAEFESFRREVSDAVEAADKMTWPAGMNSLRRFILPKSVDPLVEAMSIATANTKCLGDESETEARVRVFRQALSARGGRVVFGEE